MATIEDITSTLRNSGNIYQSALDGVNKYFNSFTTDTNDFIDISDTNHFILQLAANDENYENIICSYTTSDFEGIIRKRRSIQRLEEWYTIMIDEFLKQNLMNLQISSMKIFGGKLRKRGNEEGCSKSSSATKNNDYDVLTIIRNHDPSTILLENEEKDISSPEKIIYKCRINDKLKSEKFILDIYASINGIKSR
ncbi:hypothetical protein BCR32DRAFT_280674 [Anaeromyces robustus]|uniref:Uncharacterized protein n=1 Tax=Anaeromyces robustus TaxID=1754192 RepID=A0A1Y1X3I6_9FUNG|nr:hypothetical protein BCR32DRAFT_280674 [Anaeromyces robustus]|eukprot:ORX80262.1 hypothetical protein BCR32DRAFT_280674 [Anaeromyces robustus]